MKVTEVQTLRASRFTYIKVHTDEGITGVGELHPASGTGGTPFTPLAAVGYCAEYLVGKDPLHIERHWQHMFRRCVFRGGADTMAAIGAIDMALWDIKGKAAGLPVHSLLGGPTREKVRLYTHLSGSTPEELADQARSLVEEGFTAVRLYPFGDFGQDSFSEGRGLENMRFRGMVHNAVARVQADYVGVIPHNPLSCVLTAACDSSAALRLASSRSGSTSGFSSLHMFHASTPCLNIRRCFSLAMCSLPLYPRDTVHL